MKGLVLLTVIVAAEFACRTPQSGDEHGHGQAAHGHDHGHGDDDGLPAESVTLWTDKAELFMEWDPFIVGRESRFLAHITNIRDPKGFKAVADGQVTVTVAVKGQDPQVATVGTPERLGIFLPAITPTSSGRCSITLELTSESLDETFRIPDCTVHADEASARSAASGDEPSGQIGFLKEQQWPIAFATAQAQVAPVTPSKTINAKISAVPGREARLTAATAGRLSLATPPPLLGSPIARGQLLARIQPTVTSAGNVGTLKADVQAARAEHVAALTAQSRLEALVASDSVPKRRLEEATAAVEVAKARLDAATARLAAYNASASGAVHAGSGAFLIRSPIAGTLVEHRATQGETVEAGALLFTVIDLEAVWVEGRAFEPDLPIFERATSAWFTVAGRDEPFHIGPETGRLVTIGQVIDPKSRTAPVVYEVSNKDRMLRIGQFAKLSVGTGNPVTLVVVPDSAVLTDGNQEVVYVQTGGEAFERRVVTLGPRGPGVVGITSGVSEGERVVTVGAYDVKLAASAGGAPAHGHAH